MTLKRSILILMTLTSLAGCTALQETLVPHRETLSPCACLGDATPINAETIRKVRV